MLEPSGHDGAPLCQCGRAASLVFLTTDEMTFLVEMIVDVCVNRAELGITA